MITKQIASPAADVAAKIVGPGQTVAAQIQAIADGGESVGSPVPCPTKPPSDKEEAFAEIEA